MACPGSRRLWWRGLQFILPQPVGSCDEAIRHTACRAAAQAVPRQRGDDRMGGCGILPTWVWCSIGPRAAQVHPVDAARRRYLPRSRECFDSYKAQGCAVIQPAVHPAVRSVCGRSCWDRPDAPDSSDLEENKNERRTFLFCGPRDELRATVSPSTPPRARSHTQERRRGGDHRYCGDQGRLAVSRRHAFPRPQRQRGRRHPRSDAPSGLYQPLTHTPEHLAVAAVTTDDTVTETVTVNTGLRL